MLANIILFNIRSFRATTSYVSPSNRRLTGYSSFIEMQKNALDKHTHTYIINTYKHTKTTYVKYTHTQTQRQLKDYTTHNQVTEVNVYERP